VRTGTRRQVTSATLRLKEHRQKIFDIDSRLPCLAISSHSLQNRGACPNSSVLWRGKSLSLRLIAIEARIPADRKFDRGWRKRAYVHYPDLP
jgi:hypothetical protein